MKDINIDKKANGYLVEISANYALANAEEEVFLYKTREEMEADLPNLVARAHSTWAEEKEQIDAEK